MKKTTEQIDDKVRQLNPANIEGSKEFNEAQEIPDTDSDGQIKELDEELSDNLKQKEQSEKELKFVIIGGNDTAINKPILNAIKDFDIDITIFELTNAEMKFIINSRAEVKAEETSVEYIKNEENRKRINEWCKSLTLNHAQKYLGSIIGEKDEERRKEIIDNVIDGKTKVWMTKSTLKKVSGLSWKEFNELFGTLELFGAIEYAEFDSDTFTLSLDQEQIVKNKQNEIFEMLKFTKAKVTTLLKSENLKADDKKKLKSMQTKINNLVK